MIESHNNDTPGDSVSPQFLLRFSFCLLFSIVFSVAYTFITDDTRQSLVARGDFPCFYSAAVLVASGRASELYAPAAQAEIQQAAWPAMGKSFYEFAYPPYAALLLSPLGFMGPLAAKGVFIAVLLAALFTAAFCMKNFSGFLKQDTLPRFTYLLFTLPVLTSILNGQNTAFSMAIYAGGSSLLLSGGRKRDFLAGVVFGLWLFKPQYGIPAMLFLLLAGRYTAFTGSLFTAFIYYLMGWAVTGAMWPLQWIQTAFHFSSQNVGINGTQMISLPALYRQIESGTPGVFYFLYLTLMAVFLIAAVKTALSARDGLPSSMHKALMLFGPAIIALSPPVLFYDYGIALIGITAGFAANTARQLVFAAVFNVLLSAVFYYQSATAPVNGFAIFNILVFAVFVWRQMMRRDVKPGSV